MTPIPITNNLIFKNPFKLKVNQIILYLSLLLFFIILSLIFFNKNNSKTLPGDIDVDELVRATNSATVALTVGVVYFDRVDFYLNNKKVKQLKINNGNFSTDLTGLQPGENEIYLVGINSITGVKKKGEEYKFVFKNTPPHLDVFTPENNYATDQSPILITGKTDQETSVLVNGFPVNFKSDNNFEAEITLLQGENNIKLTARDYAGNVTDRNLTVFYR